MKTGPSSTNSCVFSYPPLFTDISKTCSFITLANWAHVGMEVLTQYEARSIILYTNEQNCVMLEITADLGLHEKSVMAKKGQSERLNL